MAKIKDIFFLILLIIPFSIYLLPLNQTSFYPLAIGNEWEFNSDFDPHSDIIGDTMEVNGIVYYGFGRTSDEPEYWLRTDKDIIYTLNTSDNKEYILFNFKMEVGDSVLLPEEYRCSFGTKIYLIGKNDTIITPAGTFYHCYHFKHIPNCSDAGIHDTWFSEGIGKVKYTAEYITGMQEFLLTDYSIPVSIKSQSERLNSTSFQLPQNYPNPFNPKTVIRYTFPLTSHLELSIYNTLGQMVATLVNGKQSPGKHEVEWNASGFASGIYLYQLKIGDQILRRKMILIR